MAQKKERAALTVEAEQLEEVRRLAEAEDRSLAWMTRALLNEAISLRKSQVEISPQQAERCFEKWGKEFVAELAIAAIRYLGGLDDGDVLAAKIGADREAGREPAAGDVSVLAHELKVDPKLLSDLLKINGKTKRTSSNA